MIVQCDKCLTKYDLDENIVRDEGSRVRCSVCRNVFTVLPMPEAEGAQDQKEDLEDTASFQFEESEDTEAADRTQEEFESEEEDEFFVDQEPFTGTELDEEIALAELDEEDEVEEESPEDKGAEGIKRPRSRFMTVLLFLLLIIVLAAGALYYFSPELFSQFFPFIKAEQPEESIDSGTARLTFRDVTGSFVESEDAGNLFLIKGMVKNGYPDKRGFLLIRGSILDNKGKIVKRKSTYAGNLIEEQDLISLSLDEIQNRLKSRDIMEKSGYEVRQGESIPFMIVIGNLPEDVSEFTVEAIRSSPGA